MVFLPWFLSRRVPTVAVLIAVATSAIGGIAYGSQASTATSTHISVLNGQTISITGDLQFFGSFLTVFSANLTLQCATCPGTAANPGIFSANEVSVGTNVTAGDFEIFYTLQTNSATPSNTVYRVLLSTTQVNGCSALFAGCSFPTFFVKTPTSTTSGLFAAVNYDLGTTMPATSTFFFEVLRA